MILDDSGVALPVRREPDAGLQSQRLDVTSESVHPARKAIVDGGPIAVLAEAVAGALPAIVNLHVLNAVVFQVAGDPLRRKFDLVFINLLVEEVPGAPTGGRQREA